MILGQSSWYGTDEEAALDSLSDNDIREVADVLAPKPPEPEPTGIIDSVRRAARRIVASDSQASSGPAAAPPLWPWLLGVVALGGGAYWLWKRSKKRHA